MKNPRTRWNELPCFPLAVQGGLCGLDVPAGAQLRQDRAGQDEGKAISADSEVLICSPLRAPPRAPVVTNGAVPWVSALSVPQVVICHAWCLGWQGMCAQRSRVIKSKPGWGSQTGLWRSHGKTHLSSATAALTAKEPLCLPCGSIKAEFWAPQIEFCTHPRGALLFSHPRLQQQPRKYH